MKTIHPIEVHGLTFAYASGSPVLRDVHLSIPRGARTLLLGANGAGKTTLLRVLGGKHLIPEPVVQILGEPAFHATSLVTRVGFVGGVFPFDADLTVAEVLAGQRGLDPGRVERVRSLLDVRANWHMNRVSDGQRRRVQLLLALARPLEVLLLDEATSDLDILARADLLRLLRDDSETRGTTIVYATHVMDGLEAWATHVAYLCDGAVARFEPLAQMADLAALRAQGVTSPLLRLFESWLRAERHDATEGEP